MTYRQYAFNQKEADHELKTLNETARLQHPFALKMATLICLSVVSSVVLCGMYLGTITKLSIGATMIVAIFLGGVSFKFTRSACL